MFISYNWLKEYVDVTDITPEQLADKITKSGIEVEGVVVLNNGIKNVVIGHVLECGQHPNAEKLHKCLVDIGEGDPVQIICGAPNVGKGQKVAVAKPGAVLPGHVKIKKAKLRGEESNGMICSLKELGVEPKLVAKEFAEGIFVFPNDVPVGEDALALLERDDAVLELSITPNRADALSMIGTAYEVAAILDREVRLPQPEYTPSSEAASDYISVTVEAKEDNPLYIAKVIKNVKIGPSPLWMQGRLMAAGIRPHNNVVDITNYVLLEYGQPLHAFDYDRFGSKEIVVRRAYDGEELVTLDNTKRKLTPAHLVITNGTNSVALAGVMGGAESEVGDDTTTVLLESAYFTGAVIRKASRDHSLRSEASSRYEKGVDPNRIHAAAERAAQLIEKYAGGEVLKGNVEARISTFEPTVVTTTLSKINRVLGTALTLKEVEQIFRCLQFDIKTDEGQITVSVPTRRGDITIEEDLFEEVARLYGYDHIPSTLPTGPANPGQLTNYQKKRRIVRHFLEGAGLNQTVTYSLTSAEKALEYALEKRNPIKLAMPMSEEHSHLRVSIVPQLLEVLKYNGARQIDNVAIFEIGTVFLENGEAKLPEEREHLAGALTGIWQEHSWQGEKKLTDFYVAKGLLEGLFATLAVSEQITYQAEVIDGLHPGRTAAVYLNGEKLGYLGQVHPNVEKALDLKATYVFELSLDKLFAAEVPELKYEEIPRFPSVTRDVALVVNKELAAATLQQVIAEAGGKLLKDVQLFDLYEGEHMEKGKKSLAFSLTYFAPDRTLTDEEVTKAHEKVLKAVSEKAGAILRS
ncbi:phenylalanine--tRNA ligase subunit beta [Bacillaceae bacterium Marseille-Q3522]|nr:phenylalanine--tRNA ligase subunit beta [Bacillaceae bacterium Marseille-Q3522]